MSKWKVYKCQCVECADLGRTSWVAQGPYLDITVWASWARAMLRATKGY